MTPAEQEADLRKRVDDLERRQDVSERFQSWITGGLAVLGVFGVLILDKIKKVLGLA